MNSRTLISVFKSNFSFHVYRKIFTSSKIPFEHAARPKKKRPKYRTMPLLVPQRVELAPKLLERPKQIFDYFLILDFEATCDSPLNVEPQEIIEFPVVKVNGNTLETESVFHSYVRPVIYPQLSDFCTELTGIIQGMVDNQPEFKEVFQNFLTWMEKEGVLKDGVKFAFVTCGDPDLDYLLPTQCFTSDIELPPYMTRWINIKRSFCDIPPYTWPDNLLAMMNHCELKHTGCLHSGLDDATNIARVLVNLAERGLVYNYNGWKKI